MTEKVQAVYITADNRKFGPFYNLSEEKLKRLIHRHGIKVDYVIVDKPKKPKKLRRRKPVNLSLLDGLDDWYPRRKET